MIKKRKTRRPHVDFTIGDRVKCVELQPIPSESPHWVRTLTLGKCYTVTDVGDAWTDTRSRIIKVRESGLWHLGSNFKKVF